jgi:hypothetical protein
MGNGMTPRVFPDQKTNFNRRGAPAALMAPVILSGMSASSPRHGAQPLARVIHWLEGR